MQLELKSLSDSALLHQTKTLVGDEARITSLVIECLEEVDRRQLHLSMGFSSLFEFATRELGYAEAPAYRRISAMRLVREIPALKPKVESGALPLTTLTQVQGFFNHAKKNGNAYSAEAKLELVESLTGQSSRECERKLAALAPELGRKDRVQPISDDRSEVRFTASRELMQDLERIRELWAHVGDSGAGKMSFEELFSRMAKLTLARIDPLTRTQKKSATQNNPQDKCGTSRPKKDVTQTRTGSIADRRLAWRRDQGQCSYIDPASKRRCTSRYALQVDHIEPYALGSESTAENFRLLCRTHNQFMARKIFGAEKCGA